MSDWHRLNPLDRDLCGDWDGVVTYDYTTWQFVRYLDRNGEHKEPLLTKGKR